MQVLRNCKQGVAIRPKQHGKGGRDELGFDGHNLVYRPLRVLPCGKTRVKQFYFRDGR